MKLKCSQEEFIEELRDFIESKGVGYSLMGKKVETDEFVEDDHTFFSISVIRNIDTNRFQNLYHYSQHVDVFYHMIDKEPKDITRIIIEPNWKQTKNKVTFKVRTNINLFPYSFHSFTFECNTIKYLSNYLDKQLN